MPTTILLVLIALLVISVLILIHELGHFVAAKLSGVWVEEFGIGLPPRLWGKKVGDTIYSVNALPFGGFVRLHGETSDQKVSLPEKSFLGKSARARIFIALAGIAMNFLLAILAFTIIFYFTTVTLGIRVIEIIPNSPAAAAGIQINDEIIGINTSSVYFSDDFQPIIASKSGQSVKILVQRGEEQKNFDIVLNKDDEAQREGTLGVVFEPTQTIKPSLLSSPFVYSYFGTVKTYFFSRQILIGFDQIFKEASHGSIPAGIAGPVGITAVFAEFIRYGLLTLLGFIAIVSINLAILNLIPFPPLDGSRVMFIVLESVVGKKFVAKIENRSYAVGMSILLILLLLLTVKEVPTLFTAGSLSSFVNTIIQ